MGEKVRIEFELQLGDEGIRVALSVPTTPVPARRMLPLFQGLTDQVVDAAVAESVRRGEVVSCSMGCGACCRQVVPISRAEAHHIRALVDGMPEPRRTEIRKRFADAVTRLEAAGMLRDVRALDTAPELHPRYFALGIPCPFLEDESCSIYSARPLVCREYLVTTPAAQCGPEGGPVRTIPLHGFVSHAVAQLEVSSDPDTRVALVLALEWAEAHAGDAPASRLPVEWIDGMLDGMTRKRGAAGADEPERHASRTDLR
jgi:Fe-S-cluster containining protein